MKQIKSVKDINNLGDILSIWAHPDDESYLAAGVMAAAVKNGQRVLCVTATKGEAGSQDEAKWPTNKLAEVREIELKCALNCLGVRSHKWLNYRDGCCCEVPDNEAIRKIKEIINEFQPKTILTFGPDGLTGHPDHSSVSNWVKQASKDNDNVQVYHSVHTYDQYNKYLKLADEKLNIFFNIDKPPLHNEEECSISFRLPPEICKLKCDAIASMPSQTEIFFKMFGRNYIKDAFSSEYFIKQKN